MKTLALLLVVLLTGCAGVINGLAPTDCYDATSGSVSVTNSAGQVIVAKPAETVRFCPPSIKKVPSAAAVVAGPAVAKAASAP